VDEDKRCNTCRWYGEKRKDNISTMAGKCRRHAPTIEGFPIVLATDIACGDYQVDGDY